MKILLAADGSPYTQSAAKHLVEHLGWFAQRPEVHILHVRPPIPYAGAAAAVGKAALEKYESDESRAALDVAEKVLAAAGIPYKSSWSVGDVAPELGSYVR